LGFLLLLEPSNSWEAACFSHSAWSSIHREWWESQWPAKGL
jgi:hypothetical protein